MGLPRARRPAAPPPAPSRRPPRGGRCRRAGHRRAGGRRGRRRPSRPRRRAVWRASRRCGRREPRRRRAPPSLASAPNAIASCEPSGLKASPLTRRQVQRPADQLALVEVPDPHAPPPPRTSAAASRPPRPKASAPDAVAGSVARSGPRGARRAGRRAARPGVPEADAPPPPATASRRPSGEYSIASAERPAKASKPPVLRSVSASIRSTLPSNLAAASVLPSGLRVKAGGEARVDRWQCWCGRGARAGGGRPRPRFSRSCRCSPYRGCARRG